DRTWAFSLEPFRASRARNGSGSAALLADPYGSYAEAVREAPARVRLARWLEDRRKDRNVPAPAGLAVALSISGDARSGGSLVDPSTGKRLIRLESRAFVPGPAVMEITGEALRVTQGSATVYFELKDVFRFWGGKMERSPRESLAQARLKESDLATRKLLSRGIGELLDEPAGSPSPRAVQRMEIFNREAGVLLMDGSGVLSVLLSPETSRRLQRADRAHFTVAGFRPGGAYRPRWMAVAHRGPVLILEDAADPQKLHAFALGGLRQAEGGKKKGGLTPLGVFRTMAQVGDAAAFSPLGLLEEAAARAADWAAGAAPDLEARVFAFNLQKPMAKATLNDGQGLYLESPFTGAVRRVRTQSHQNSLWTLSILLTADGPLLLARAVPSKVREPFKAYGPLVFGDALDRPEVAVWRGDREASLSSAAESLSRTLDRPVSVPRAGEIGPALSVPSAERAAERARAALGPGSARWPGMSPAERRRTYLEVLNGLREVLAVNNDSEPWLERRRNALITAEILFNDKSPADVAVLYAPLLNADDALLPLLLSREGEFEKRRVALAKKLTDLVLSSGMAGAAALPRYRQFLAAMDGLLPAPAAAESGNSALRGTVLFLALLAPLAWLAAAVPGGLWPGVEFLAGGGPASWWENTWLGPLVLAMAPLGVPGSPRSGDADGLLHPSFVAHDRGVWQILRDQTNLPADGRRVVYGGAGVDLANALLSTDGDWTLMVDRNYGLTPEILRAVFGKDTGYLERATASYAEAKHKAGFAGFTRLVPGERLAEVLWRELRSLGIDSRAVSVRGIGRDIELEFSWAHPNGDGLRRRIVVFREGDLVDRPSIVEEPWDVYYQRAPMKMPEAYARPDNYVARLETLRRPNGVYVTDDVTDFLLNRPGPGARADRAAQFPLRTREWPMPEALENAVLEFKYPGEPLQRLRGRLTEGYGYGWRVRIREPLTRSGEEGRPPA
ncbi:MAG TPA: hypothetical protein PLO76_05685, partial [Elusimicrobiota bacterium]|nr:hypothetical protein [Elusimicrobiota bacterium]